MQEYEYYKDLFSEEEYPLAFVDLDALDRNVESVRDRADGVPVRVASKSVRCTEVLERVLRSEGIRGVMSYSGYEACRLGEHGFDDILVAYPVWHTQEITAVCGANADIVLMVDSPEHGEKIDSVAEGVDVVQPVCIDLDMSSKIPGLHFGVMRSGIRNSEDALELAEIVDNSSNLELRGLMGYEAQIAGLPDRSPANNMVANMAIRLLKKWSTPRILRRRERVVNDLQEEYGLEFVNGGGTGSVEVTTNDSSVTEVTVGSGFYSPHLFDYYDSFQHEAAAGYAIEVTRKPEPGIYTCRGGGYVASGPPGKDKIPKPVLPRGAELLDNEAAGEVQTPIRYGGDLSLGDPIIMRHSKAGELCEHFQTLHLVSEGEVVSEAPTYRGMDWCFL